MKCRPPLVLASGVAIAALSLLVAACGSNSPARASSSGGQPTQAQMQQDAVNFSDCMRSHGVAAFPDPSDPHAFKSAMSPDSAEARSPAFQSASAACAHLLPGGGPRSQSSALSHAQIAAFLAFARCLRSHGFPSFPDPTSSGQLTHQMVASAGINLHQPAVLQAGDACVGVTHGFMTEAMVARFIAEG
jgi:hypothetical protein